MKKVIIFIAALMLLGLILIGAGCGGGEIIIEPEETVYTDYTSTKYGFSFEYPEKWYLVDNPEFGTIFLSSKEEEPPMGGASLGARIEIFVIENAENLEQEQEQDNLSKTVYLTRDDYTIQINYTGREPDYAENLKHFEHLLESFEFKLIENTAVENTAMVIEKVVYKEKEVIKEVPVEVPGLCPEPKSASKTVFFNIPAFNESVPESTPGLNPDLVIQALNFYPTEPVEGDLVIFWAIVENRGEGNFIDSSSVYLNIDSNLWAETIMTGLTSNKARNVVWDKKWKAISGEHLFEVCIENNCIETSFVISRALAMPDYVIDSGSMIPISPTSGDILSFSATVKNQGKATGIGSSMVSFYLDINNDGRWDITTKDAVVDILVPSGKEKELFKFVWVATPGTHRYEICADSGSNIKESNETNNCKSVRFVIK